MALFVKHLENVQGDERDCILISTTFGKPQAAVNVVRQNFGPISRQGGWRRLNVLFTRARKSIGLITSMWPEHIIADSNTPEGTRALRNYLEYARSGILPQESKTGLEPDSDFEIAVINLIESWGYSVTPQLGVAGFRIDIAVKHPCYPSVYLAAVECDGASYHSGQSVRDRDRIRQEILEGLGWKGKIWRIWSTDWFRSPLTEANKLKAFLESLKNSPIPSELVIETEASSGDADSGGSEIPFPAAVDEQSVSIDILGEDEEDIEVEIGDMVSFCSANGDETDLVTVHITQNQNNFDQGIISSHTPLAQALMGVTVGETVVLRVPGQPAKQFVIKGIKRLS
jgi:transcription elongation GreA/GreB family factor